MSKIQLPVNFTLPSLPNFIRSESGAVVDVADLPPATLEAIGALWTRALVSHARARRAQSEPEVVTLTKPLRPYTLDESEAFRRGLYDEGYQAGMRDASARRGKKP